jgi:DNA-directed RNA polymerase I, II, and III subunit RPABC5
MVLADKYRFYLQEVKKVKEIKRDKTGKMQIEKMIYLTKERISSHEKTAEGQVLDDLRITNVCCRRHLLTAVEI